MMSEGRRFQGKTALITASTAGKTPPNIIYICTEGTMISQTFDVYHGFAGIGLGIALRLGKEGAKLVICSRKKVDCQRRQKIRSIAMSLDYLHSHHIEEG